MQYKIDEFMWSLFWTESFGFTLGEHDMFRKYEIVKFMSELRMVWEYMDSLRWMNIVE